jgi:adenylate cyclase
MKRILRFFSSLPVRSGPGNALVSGPAAVLREEARVFLLLDLNASTPLAQALGNLRYSQFLVRFFATVQEAVRATGGEIYQYAGDQVLVSWPYPQRAAVLAGLDCYFRVQRRLAQQKPLFVADYGCCPAFKAALHGGMVAVTRVGDTLLYHGDVLNTAARIEETCKQAGQPLLLSAEVVKGVAFPRHYRLVSLQSYLMKGKHTPVTLYTVFRVEDRPVRALHFIKPVAGLIGQVRVGFTGLKLLPRLEKHPL